MRVIDETGSRYGRLTVLSREGITKGRAGFATWLCRCDCGRETTVAGSDLRRGHTKSCGCLPGNFHSLPEGQSAFNRLFTRIKRGARQHGRVWELSREQVRVLTSQPCHYCERPPSQMIRSHSSEYTYNDIDRVDNDLGYTESNCVPCCMACNRAKWTQPVEQFLAERKEGI